MQSGAAALDQKLQLTNRSTADVEGGPAHRSQDGGHHKEESGVDTQHLTGGDHAISGVGDDREDDDEADCNAGDAHGGKKISGRSYGLPRETHDQDAKLIKNAAFSHLPGRAAGRDRHSCGRGCVGPPRLQN